MGLQDGTLVVDGDGHVMEPEDLWTARMDASRWGDWIPHKESDHETYETIYTGGAIRGGGRELQYQMAEAVGMTPKEFYDLLASLRRPGGYDPDARVVDMDADGIDAAVLYPSQAMFFGPNDPIPALARHRLRDRLHPRVQRLDLGVLRRAADATVRRRRRAAAGRRPRRRRSATRGRRARTQGHLHPAVGVPVLGRRRRPPAQPPRLRPVLGRVPGAGRAGRVPPRRPRRHARRVPEVRSGRTEREHVGHEHGDGRAARGLGPRPVGRQRGRHDRDPGPPAHGRRLRTLSRPLVPRSSRPAADGSRACSSGWTSR